MANFKIPEGRIGWNDFAKPNEQGRYKLTLLLDKTEANVNWIKTVMVPLFNQVAASKWTGVQIAPPIMNSLTPNNKGVVPAETHGFGNCLFLRLSTTIPPATVDGALQPLDPNLFYRGAYVYTEAHVYSYDKEGNRGISFGLNCVQFSRNGPALVGGDGGSQPTTLAPIPVEQPQVPHGAGPVVQPAQPAQPVQQYVQPAPVAAPAAVPVAQAPVAVVPAYDPAVPAQAPQQPDAPWDMA